MSLAGSSAMREGGNSHSLTFCRFSQQFSADPTLSQEIDGLAPLVLLEENRNAASYKAAPFLDLAPNVLLKKSAPRLRQHLSTYLRCDLSLCVFDPDHSVIVYLVRLLIKMNNESGHAEVERVHVSNHYIKMLGSANCFAP